MFSALNVFSSSDPSRQWVIGSPGAQRTASRANSIPPWVTSGAYSATVLPTYQRTANQPPRIASRAGANSNQRLPDPRRIVTTDGNFAFDTGWIAPTAHRLIASGRLTPGDCR